MMEKNDGEIKLSPRQKDILSGIAKGESNKQIADDYHISEATVKMHVSALLRVLGVKNRVQILIKAKEEGLIT